MVTGKEGRRRKKEGENSSLNAEAVHCIGEVSCVQMKEGRGRRGGGGSSLLESEGRVEVGHLIDQVSSPSQRLSYL